ncbi:MAG: AEC family transporter [Clostridiales Family XIII bacterium]|jgi:predicted permease|nr:AEC family transporter [Clostridiales Family XIII bacterium]
MLYGQFIIFFLLLFTGFACKKIGIFSDTMITGINKFIILVAYPCLILARTVSLEMEPSIFTNFILTMFINFGLLMLFGGMTFLLYRARRYPKEDASISEFATMSSNNGFMGFPIAVTFFGDLGLLYMVASNIALNTMFFTYGIGLMGRDRKRPKESVRKKIVRYVSLIANPKISSAIVGVVLCYNHIMLPEIAMDYLELVGSVATPLAMISIGTMLAGGFGPKSFATMRVMEPAIYKLFLIPLITFVIVWFLPLDPMVKTILVVGNAMPVATTVAILCEQYDRNKSYAGEMLVVSTIFSMATVPLWIAWLPF